MKIDEFTPSGRSKRVVRSWYHNNDGTRTLFESIVDPDVELAIKQWKKSAGDTGVLIGGLALSYHAKPRQTMDIDVLYLNQKQIPDKVDGFKRIRDHAYLNLDTHVEIEILDANFLNINAGLVQTVIDNAVNTGGMPVADAGGLIALKLQRGNRRDLGDIETLIPCQPNIEPYREYLTDVQIETFEQIKRESIDD